MNQDIRKISYYFIGIIFLSLGVSLTLLSNLGAGGWDALTENISKLIDIKIGTIILFIGITLVLLAALIKREIPNLAALIVSAVTGKVINFWYYSVFKGSSFDNFMMSFLILILGIIAIGLGCAMIFVTNFPKNHTETFVFSITNTFNLEYKFVKTAADTSALLISFILGLYLKDFSNFGIGTILNTFFMGNIIHFMMPTARKGLNFVLKT